LKFDEIGPALAMTALEKTAQFSSLPGRTGIAAELRLPVLYYRPSFLKIAGQ
jgi:hypothetical protein